MKVLRTAINLSEGRNLETIEKIKEAVLEGNQVDLVDVNVDKDHNRAVFLIDGEPEKLLEATKRLALKTIELIDMRNHKGGHPRLGALDVVPFLPNKNVSLDEAKDIAWRFGEFLGEQGIPVYFISGAARKPERQNIAYIRKGEYEGLAEKILQEEFIPDEGPQIFIPKSGATMVGARYPVVALNVNLKTEDLEIGRVIAKGIRGSSGSLQGIRAIAVEIPERKLVQISTMVDDHKKTPVHRVFETIKAEANRYGIAVEGSELVGGTPLAAMEDVIRYYLQAHDFTIDELV